MRKLLIVDDEPEVVEGLQDILSSITDLEIETAFVADDALFHMTTHPVDVVLADIHMPGISGVEMAEIISRQWPKTRVIFFSGVRDFDVIYRSIQNPTVRYLTKMEPDEKIRQTVCAVLDEMEAAQQEEKDHSKLEKALPLLKEQTLYKLLMDPAFALQTTYQQLAQAALPLNPERPLSLMMIQFLHAWALSPVALIQQQTQIIEQLRKQSVSTSTVVYTLSMKSMVFVLLQLSENPFKNLPRVQVRIDKWSRQQLGQAIIIGITPVVETLADLPGRVSALLREQLQPSSHTHPESNINYEKILASVGRLQGYLELGKQELFMQTLNDMTIGLRKISSFNDAPALEVYFGIVTVYQQFIALWQLQGEMEKQLSLKGLQFVDAHENWQTAVDYLIAVGETIFSLRFKMQSTHYQGAVIKVQSYIRTHLNANLSITALGELASFNPNYLSRQFKEATGVSLSDYVIRVRMEAARDALLNTNDRINQIGRDVGYNSLHSFLRAFRKTYGCTPAEWRERTS